MEWLNKLLLKLIGTATSYPDQEIPDKALQAINDLDVALLKSSAQFSEVNNKMSIVHFQIGLWDQVKPVDTYVKYMLAHIDPAYAYIPRSIAFVISPDGNWHFFIGVYRNVSFTDEISLTMFTDMLSRTNTARSKHA